MKAISYSAIRIFKECPAKYKYTYIDKIKLEGKTNIYGAFGSAVHLCIKKFYDEGIFNRKYLLSLWKNCFNEEIYKQQVEKVSDNEYQRLIRQGYPILQKFYTTQQKQNLLQKPIATELEFNIPCKNKDNDSIMLVGRIDNIFKTKDGFEIVDYKTTASKYQWLNNKIDLQLILYYVAFTLLKREFKKMKCKVCLHFLRPGIKKYFNITKEDIIRLLKEINRHMIEVNQSDFKPNPTKLSCKFCSYTNLCLANQIEEKGIIKGKLFPYQKTDVAFCLFKKQVLNSNEMGLGKTIEMIYIGEKLKKDNRIKNILVVTPNNMKYQWKKKLNEFVKNPDIMIIEGSRKQRKILYHKKSFWNIIGYDIIRSDIDYIKKVWDMIVLDDPSVFKYWKTRTRKAIDRLKINKKTNYKFILTATPIENNLAEMYSMVRYLDFSIFGKRSSFDNKYVERGYFNRIIKYKNIFNFIAKIKPILIRNKIEDVKKDLPPVIMKYNYVDFLPEQAKLYDAVVKSLEDYLSKKIENGKANKVIDSEALSKFTYLREICDSTKLVAKENYSGKTEKLKDILLKALPNKIIVFSEFVKMLEILKKELPYKSIIVTGQDTAKEKFFKVEKFKKSKEINVLLCTDVLKYGQDLQFAHYLINFDLPWKYTTLEQRWGRERRIGQKAKQVIVINLVMNGGCEDRMIEILGYKKKLSHIIDEKKYDKIEIPGSSGITYKTLKEIISKKNDKAN